MHVRRSIDRNDPHQVSAAEHLHLVIVYHRLQEFREVPVQAQPVSSLAFEDIHDVEHAARRVIGDLTPMDDRVGERAVAVVLACESLLDAIRVEQQAFRIRVS